MRFATVRTAPGRTVGARVEGDELVLLEQHRDAAAALASPDAATAAGSRAPLDTADLGPPVGTPNKIICLGMNYAAHIAELGREPPDHPTLFAKFARALIGPRDDIVLPHGSQQVDWEVELAFVIAREVRHARGRAAWDAIGGYTVLNDISARDVQWRTPQWLAGKTAEDSTPVGPWLVTPDEVDHARDLEVSCAVDGEVMQRARTSELVFSAGDVVEYVSAIVTLEPGDLISTGTPGGVGAGRQPPVFLRPGQEVRTAIEGIGELINVCRAGPTP